MIGKSHYLSRFSMKTISSDWLYSWEIRCSDEIYREVFKDNYFGLLEVDCIPLMLSLNSQAYINDYWSETIISWLIINVPI